MNLARLYLPVGVLGEFDNKSRVIDNKKKITAA